MTLVARPYQQAQIEAVTREWRSVRSTLVSSPTGTGKTELFCLALERRLAEHPDHRALVLAHSRKLVFQAAERIKKRLGIDPIIEMGDYRNEDRSASDLWECPIVVGTMQTIATRCRESRLAPDRVHTLIIDEAHRTAGATYRKLVAHYHNAKILGVTATPDRTDEQKIIGRGNLYESLAYHYPLYHEMAASAITDGWLVPIRQGYVKVEGLELAQIAKQDYSAEAIEKIWAQEQILHRLCSPLPQVVGDRQGVIFCATIDQAEAVSAVLPEYAPRGCVVVHGKVTDEDRESRLAAFESRAVQYVVTVDALIEGWDSQAVEAVIVYRPTKSRSRKAQMVGRGTRPIAGLLDGVADPAERRRLIAESAKPELLVIDFYSTAADLELNVDVTDLYGMDDYEDVTALAKSMLLEQGDLDAAIALKQARRRRQLEREFRAAVALMESRLVGLKASALVDVYWKTQYGRTEAEPERPAYRPDMPTTKQLKYAIALGFPVSKATTASRAEVSRWIGDAKARGDEPTQQDWAMARRWERGWEQANG